MVAAAALLRPASPDVEALVRSIHDVTRAVLHRAHPALEAEGLSMGQFWALHLVSSLGSARVSLVAQHLAVSAPTLCAKVDELERAGLLARHRSERDHRVVELSLTPKGRRVEARLWRRISTIVRSAAGDLPAADVATSVRVFRALSRQLDAAPVRPGGLA